MTEEVNNTNENVDNAPAPPADTDSNVGEDTPAQQPKADEYLYDMPEEDFRRMIEGETVDIPDKDDKAGTPDEGDDKADTPDEGDDKPDVPDEKKTDEDEAFRQYLKELSGSDVKSVEDLAKIHKEIRDKYSQSKQELAELDKFAKEHNYESYREMMEDIKSKKTPDEPPAKDDSRETQSSENGLKNLNSIWEAEERQAEELDARMKRMLDERGESEDYSPTLPEVRRAREASAKIAQAIISDAAETIVPQVISALNERISPTLKEFADMSARNGLKMAFNELPDETREAHGAYAQNIIDYILENKSAGTKAYFEAHLKGENPFINGVIEDYVNSHPDIKSLHDTEKQRRNQEYIDKKLAAEKKRMLAQRMGATKDDSNVKTDPSKMSKAERDKYLNDAAKEAMKMLQGG